MYKNTFSYYIRLVIVLLVFSNINAQSNIAEWDFESFPNGFTNPSTSFGTGTASVITQSGITPSGLTSFGGYGNMSPCGGNVQAGSAWQVFQIDPGTFSESNGVQFTASTVGYENIFFKWVTRWSNSAPNTIRLKYTIDGTTWLDYIMTNGNTTYCNGVINTNGTFEADTSDSFKKFTVDFSSISGAINNPNFGIRILAAHYQTSGQFRRTDNPTIISTIGGAWRMDNIVFAGSLFAGSTDATISSSSLTVCGGDTVNLGIAITGGNPPFNLIYTNDGGTTLFTVPNYSSGTLIPIVPTATKTYSIVSVQNAPAVIGTSNFSAAYSGAPVITFNAKPTFNANTAGSACPGAFNLASLFTAQLPAGGTSSYINDATSVAIPFALSYSGPTVTIRYTYTKSGCSTTKIVTFTRNTAPAITTQPSNATQTVCLGDIFPAISVVATGINLVYTWFINGTNSNSGGTAIPSTNSASYTPSSIATGTNYYYVQISNPCGATKSSTLGVGKYVVVPKSTTRTLSAPQSICSGYAPNDLVLSGTGSIIKWQKSTDPTFAVGVTDIPNTTTTLATGNLTTDTYFRAIVNNGFCDVPTAPIAITIKTANYTTTGWDITPDATTTAIIWNNFSSTSNFTVCNLILKPGVIATINSNHILTVQNEIDASAGTLIFENNSNLVQLNDNANSNVGNIVYKRTSTVMNVYDFTFWSSPVINQNLNLFSPSTFVDKYYSWDTTPTVYNWKILNSFTTTMDQATGYCIRSPLAYGSAPAAFTGIFTGRPNNGIINKPVEVSNGGLNALNLIGNPYPSALKADDFLNINGLVINKSLFLWTHNSPVGTFVANQYSDNDYATYNLAGGTGTKKATNLGVNNNVPNGFIASGQAFFVQAIDNANLVFNNTMRDNTNATSNQFFRTNNSGLIEKNRVWLEMSNVGGAFSQTLFGYIQNATDYKDNGYDTNLFDESPTISIYSVLDNDKLSIKSNALPFADNKTNQLGFISKIDSDYEIKLSMYDGLFDYQNVFLQDNLLNVVHDLKQSNYNFHTSIGTFNDRFLLRFNNNSLANETVKYNVNNLQVFKQNNNLLFQSSNNSIKTISIFDLNGRLLFEVKNINAINYAINNLQIASQIVLIKTTLENDIVVTKKLIF